jgi:hypothetical protein
LLGHPAQSDQDDFPRLPAQHFEDRGARYRLLIKDLLEHRCL